MFYSLQDGRLSNLMENNSSGVFRTQAQHLIQVPTDGLSLTVFIGSQPNGLSLLRESPQVFYNTFFIGRYFILWGERINVHTKTSFLQVTDMSVTRNNLIVLSQEFFYSFCLSRALHYYQIILHRSFVFYNCGGKGTAFFYSTPYILGIFFAKSCSTPFLIEVKPKVSGFISSQGIHIISAASSAGLAFFVLFTWQR